MAQSRRTAVQSQILKGPVNALKEVGDSVKLECVTISNSCALIEWRKMEGAQSPLTVYRDGIILNGLHERYSVSGSGGCNLAIRKLEVSDSGRFSCVLTVGDTEKSRHSILVVIEVKEACRSNVTSNTFTEDDHYSFWTAINVPAKSVEPSDVTLSFQNKTVGERETMNNSQSQTVRTTLIGIAREENIMPRVCRASLTPNTAYDFDRTNATLDVCMTQQLNVSVSYSVKNIAVSSGPYYKGVTVHCTASGYPNPEIKWFNLMSGVVIDGDTLVITGKAGDKYKCTATNTVKGKPTSQSVPIEVSSDSSYVGAIVGCVIAAFVAIVVALVVCWFVVRCPLYKWLHSITDKKTENGVIEQQAAVPLTESTPTSGPVKPQRANDPAPNRPKSECLDAELLSLSESSKV